MAVCCLDEAGSWGEGLRREDVGVTALGRRDGFQPQLGHAIARIATRHHARVVHCHHYSPFVYASIARLWSPNLRIIFTEHGRLSDAPPSAKRRTANRVLSHAPREVVTVSRELKHHLVAEGFPAAKVNVIHNGIDVGPLPTDRHACAHSPRAGPPEQRRRRRHHRAAGSGQGSAHADSRGRTAGSGRADDPAGGRRRIRARPARSGGAEIGAESSVRFLGHREDARDLLAACDVYANSSISEGISLTILEAMAAGLPVVATQVGGTAEIVDATCGRLVPARNPEALAGELAALAADAALRLTLGGGARARVEQHFTLDRMVREYRDAYYAAAA